MCCFMPINSTFGKKHNLDKVFPYNGLEHDISILINEGDILLLGYFNVGIETNQAIILNNYSNPNPLWLDEVLVLANRNNINFEDMVDNLFGVEIIKLWSSQYLTIYNGLMKWYKSS